MDKVQEEIMRIEGEARLYTRANEFINMAIGFFTEGEYTVNEALTCSASLISTVLASIGGNNERKREIMEDVDRLVRKYVTPME